VIAGLLDVDGIAVARLPADVDAANSSRLREELSAAVPHGSRDLVADLRGTAYFDSAGIDMLFRIAHRLSERRAVLRVVIPPDSQLRRLADIVGLDRAMAIHTNLEDAVAAARAGQVSIDAPKPSSSPPPAWRGSAPGGDAEARAGSQSE
jgi:anti-sigma B factor antagonist